MDLLTYMIMSVIFGGIVLLHNGDANTDWSEIVFSLYIFVSDQALLRVRFMRDPLHVVHGRTV